MVDNVEELMTLKGMDLLNNQLSLLNDLEAYNKIIKYNHIATTINYTSLWKNHNYLYSFEDCPIAFKSSSKYVKRVSASLTQPQYDFLYERAGGRKRKVASEIRNLVDERIINEPVLNKLDEMEERITNYLKASRLQIDQPIQTIKKRKGKLLISQEGKDSPMVFIQELKEILEVRKMSQDTKATIKEMRQEQQKISNILKPSLDPLSAPPPPKG